MATNNSSNNQYTNNADGFTLGGGTTTRNLTVTGGNVTLTGAGSNTYTMPASTDTLVGRASTDTLTNKTIDANGTGNSITNVANLSFKRQSDTSNATVTGGRIETGWGFIVGNGTSALTETVTYGSSFTTAPIVLVSYGGDQTNTTPSYGSGGLNVRASVLGYPYSISTTGFSVRIQTTDATTWTSGQAVYYQWIAIGA